MAAKKRKAKAHTGLAGKMQASQQVQTDAPK
jgi:hypothetical protein